MFMPRDEYLYWDKVTHLHTRGNELVASCLVLKCLARGVRGGDEKAEMKETKDQREIRSEQDEGMRPLEARSQSLK